MRGGVSPALKFPKKPRGQSPSSIEPAVLTHAQAVEQNYKLVMDPERWAENGGRRNLLRVQTDRYADILERFGIQARLDRLVTDLGSCTGGMDWAEGFRNTNVLPLVASRNRRSLLRDTQYWMMHVAERPSRYAVVTFGANVDLYGPLREITQTWQRRISKWAVWAREEFGVNVVGRFGEMTVNENLSLHPHANVIYWLDRPLTKDRWKAFLNGSYSRFGALWRDNGSVRDAAEIVKYFAKGDDLSLLADMACQVKEWADREVPQAALVEAIAYRIAAKRSAAEKRPVRAEECVGFAVRAVTDGVARMRTWAAEGKPHPLVWLFHQMHRLHLAQSMGGLLSFRRELKEDRRKVVFVSKDGDAPFLVQVKMDEWRRDDRDKEDDKGEEKSDPPMIVENRILAVTMPQPRFSPWAEPIIKIQNFTPNPRTDSGANGLRRIQKIQERALAKWFAAGSPEPSEALAVARAVRADDRQGGTRASGGVLPGLVPGGHGDGEAGAGPYRSHNNDNCPGRNSRLGVHILGDGSIVDRETGEIVYRQPTVDEVIDFLGIEEAAKRAATLGNEGARPHFFNDPPGTPPDQRSLSWKIRNYGNHVVDDWADCALDIWYADKFIEEPKEILNGRKNFFGVEGADDECDIPF